MKINTINWLALFLLVVTTLSHAEPVKQELLNSSIMLLDFKLEGDTSLKKFWKKDKQLTEQFSGYLADELSKKYKAKVLSASTGSTVIKQAQIDSDLHYCNGCEVDLAKQLNADFVVKPRIFRMSILIQTLFLDVIDVKTGEWIIHKGRNFRGNTAEGWQHAVDNLLRDLPP